MVHIAGEITINRPVDKVFDFVADARNEPRYNPKMLSAEKTTDGPIGVGTRFRDQTTSMGRPVEILIEIKSYDRPRRLTSSIRLPSMDIQGILTFDPAPGGTRMRWSWDVAPHGVLKLMTPVVAQMGRRQEKAIWSCLKQYLEAQQMPMPQS